MSERTNEGPTDRLTAFITELMLMLTKGLMTNPRERSAVSGLSSALSFTATAAVAGTAATTQPTIGPTIAKTVRSDRTVPIDNA